MSRIGAGLTILLVIAVLASAYVEPASAYSHQFYMRCCRGCRGSPRARAICYAACMARAASMPPP